MMARIQISSLLHVAIAPRAVGGVPDSLFEHRTQIFFVTISLAEGADRHAPCRRKGVVKAAIIDFDIGVAPVAACMEEAGLCKSVLWLRDPISVRSSKLPIES